MGDSGSLPSLAAKSYGLTILNMDSTDRSIQHMERFRIIGVTRIKLSGLYKTF